MRTTSRPRPNGAAPWSWLPSTDARAREWCRCKFYREYFVTITRKLHVDAGIARRKVELLAEFDVAVLEVADILAAIDLHRLHGFSLWDALVLRAAKQTG